MVQQTKPFPVFDCDSHIVEPQTIWEDYLESEYRLPARSIFWRISDASGTYLILNGKVHEDSRAGGRASIWRPGMTKEHIGSMPEEEVRRANVPGGYDPRERLKDMDVMGIDQVMLFPTSFGQGLISVENPDVAWALCRAYNNWIADYCKADPHRLFPAAVVPQQSVNFAVDELRRCAKMGFKCVQIRPNIVNGRYPQHPYYEPLWREIQELNMLAGVHPFPRTPADCSANFIWKTQDGLNLGYQVEEQLCFIVDSMILLSNILMSGLLDKFPNLKVAVLESNATWLPVILDKCDSRFHLYRNKRKVKLDPPLPSEIFYRQCFIAFEGDETAVPPMAEIIENVAIWSSDYPHHDADDAWSAIDHLTGKGVAGSVQEKLMGLNALRMYGIDPLKRSG